MKIGIYSNAFKNLSFEEALKVISDQGVHMVELGCGEESGFAHCNPEELLADEKKLKEFQETLSKYEMKISALSCHGNPLSPNQSTRELSVHSMKNAVLLAEKLQIPVINCFSGCPGDSENATLMNWITVSWPMDFAKTYEWQWKEKVLPFWKEFTSFAREHGLAKIALELHPGQVCYNPKTLKRLREECGPGNWRKSRFQSSLMATYGSYFGNPRIRRNDLSYACERYQARSMAGKRKWADQYGLF